MAVVKGVKEKVHLPLYDSISIKSGKRLGETLSSNVLRFFQDVTGKTKLQTNMQAASLLPHWNTYEAHALRVVISDLPPVVSDPAPISLQVGVVDIHGTPVPNSNNNSEPKTVTLGNFKLANYVEFLRGVELSPIKALRLSQDALENFGLTVTSVPPPPSTQTSVPALGLGEFADINRTILKTAADLFGKDVIPTNEQIFPNDGFGSLIGKFVYNTVTTFFVGEKIMIQTPTWFFPAGAGPFSEHGRVTTHGYPSPQATFRFAEAVTIDAQQNFRVEIEVTESDVLSELQRLYGPLFVWVVLDGYMTRDVQ
ncbi:MAG: hypothetical protein J2P52_01210 [Blastocatellia bacterium]|nr:hypothetical protein [Blastocatellia bacterium]